MKWLLVSFNEGEYTFLVNKIGQTSFNDYIKKQLIQYLQGNITVKIPPPKLGEGKRKIRKTIVLNDETYNLLKQKAEEYRLPIALLIRAILLS